MARLFGCWLVRLSARRFIRLGKYLKYIQLILNLIGFGDYHNHDRTETLSIDELFAYPYAEEFSTYAVRRDNVRNEVNL